jgi:hypothetical protein
VDFQEYEFFVFPDYHFTYIYNSLGGEDITRLLYNGKKDITWWVPGGRAIPRRGSEDDVAEIVLAQVTNLLITNWMEPRPLRARKEWVGLKRVDVVEADANGWRVDYYLDPKTHLPVQVVSAYGQMSHARGEMSQVVRLGDYKEVSGVMMPQEVSYSYTTNTTKWKEHVSYEINPPYDPQFFENPPSVRTGPESWRVTNKQERTSSILLH